MGGSAPQPPDPQQTAAAQTQTNLSTAIGNTYLGNMNQVTPNGTLTYTQTGQNFVSDPNGQTFYYNKDANNGQGKYVQGDQYKDQKGWDAVTGYEVPTFTATTALSPEQQKIKDQEDAASLNLATLANHQSDRIDNILGHQVDLGNAPDAFDPTNVKIPDYQKYGDGPDLTGKIANAGDIQTDIKGQGPIATSYDYSPDTQRYEDALMARLNPQLQQDASALNAKLVNQGLQPGSEAYNRAFQQQGQKENDARIAAILNAGQEQSRIAGLNQQAAAFQNSGQQQAYNEAMGRANLNNTAQAQQYQQNAGDAQFQNAAKEQEFNNKTQAISGNNALADQKYNAQMTKGNAMDQARQQYLNEQYAKRNQSINEITSLMSGAQVQNPQFVNTNAQTMPTVDYAGLVNQNYQDKLAAWQQNQAGIGQLLGGIGSLFALSDKRAKKDIKKVGKAKGINLYEYSMRGALDDGKKHIGVMAQEAEKKRPDAVMTGPDGLKRVNYGRLFEAGSKQPAAKTSQTSNRSAPKKNFGKLFSAGA